jgi:serine/threonine protein kinase/tetratricopeptide (TPR) repeat protein
MEDHQAAVTDPLKTEPSAGADEKSMIGHHVGPYRIEREIGRGGMGAVYEAWRADGEFQHRVAIKLIRSGADREFVLQRFRNERQILAALDHPNIGRLLGGGTTEDGNPYFAMEYIEGQPLYTYADANNLSVGERLRLFIQICDAAQYAHDKLVIHRDLKPTNILVSASGAPKLLDFGIAKLLNPELVSDTTPQTTLGVRLMTIEYASPEQVQALPVTFSSDVYSLGVILYELLTGRSPYRFRNLMPHEVARAIIEDEPEQPSVAVSRGGPTIALKFIDREASTVSTAADTRPQLIAELRKDLAGNLDNIVLKSLRKGPSERYESVAALRDDIIRHLNGWAVLAPAYAPVRKRGDDVKSIAILPLKLINLGEVTDTGESFLGVGLADAMITRLSGVRTLAVRPTSAIVGYNDPGSDPLRAGRELSVDYVLDGRIKMLGKRVRVSLQLLDVQRAANSWADQFDENYSDALDLEDSISAKVAYSLLPRLTGTGRRRFRKRGTDNPRAFDAYLRGRFFWNHFTAQSLPRARDSFAEAIALDPDYALAYVGLADAYIWSNIYGVLSTVDSLPRARAAAQRAIELNDSLGEAYATLGLVMQGDWEWTEANNLLQKALELNPNYPLAHEWYSAQLVGTGHFDKGIEEIKRAEELDPLSLRAMTLSAWTFYQTRHFKESITKAQRIIDLDRNNFQGHLQLSNALIEVGEFERALAEAREARRMAQHVALPGYIYCFALVAGGQRDEAEQIVQEMAAVCERDYFKPYFIAISYVALGNHDKAFEYLEKSFAERDNWLLWFATEPKLDPLRSDPRFDELFRKTNNPLAVR